MQERDVDAQDSPTGPRRVVAMDEKEKEEKEEADAEQPTNPRGYAVPRHTPVQVMSAIRRPPADPE